jgi:hypothetical protein
MIGKMKLLAVLAAAALGLSCAGAPPTSDSSPDEAPAGGQGGVWTGGPQEQFVVSQEVYARTFEEIGEFIENLNRIIRNADYESWLTFLGEQYIRTTADPDYLKDQSEKPLLKQANIRLEGLRDYFVHVVVPSRTQATLDEIEFLDENHVKAIAVLRGTRVILYLLERDEGQWKIGVW